MGAHFCCGLLPVGVQGCPGAPRRLPLNDEGTSMTLPNRGAPMDARCCCGLLLVGLQGCPGATRRLPLNGEGTSRGDDAAVDGLVNMYARTESDSESLFAGGGEVVRQDCAPVGVESQSDVAGLG